MCLIIVKPKNVELPKYETLQLAWSANSDGAGYMFASNGKVYGRKGFMDFTSLLDALTREDQKRTMVIHFRFATHGERGPSATHPFPYSRQINDMKRLEWSANLGIAHNGIIQGYGLGKLSDTQHFILEKLGKVDRRRITEKAYLAKLADITASKFAMLDAAGAYYLSGKFIEEPDGCLYSNLSHLRTWNGFLFEPGDYDIMFDAEHLCELCRYKPGFKIPCDVYISGVSYNPVYLCDECFDSGDIVYNSLGEEVLSFWTLPDEIE